MALGDGVWARRTLIVGGAAGGIYALFVLLVGVTCIVGVPLPGLWPMDYFVLILAVLPAVTLGGLVLSALAYALERFVLGIRAFSQVAPSE